MSNTMFVTLMVEVLAVTARRGGGREFRVTVSLHIMGRRSDMMAWHPVERGGNSDRVTPWPRRGG